MSRVSLAILTVALAVSSCAQESALATPASQSWIPHPVLFAGPSLVGNGYQSLAGTVGGGLLLNSRPLVADLEAYYMNAKKTDDKTIDNASGHERYLRGRLFYRLRPDLYFGGGAQWSETATTNYRKQSWRPSFGAGGDHFANSWSFRWQALYILPGNDRSNALQGPELQFWFPSPASKSHLFFRETIGIYEFHTTVTDPSNLQLTAAQQSERHIGTFVDFTIGWRF